MRKDDTFSTTMLGYALEKLAEEANDDGSRCRLLVLHATILICII